MKLIVCLGNPGDAYRDTRHNVGFMLGDRLAERLKTDFRGGKGPFDVAEASFKGEKLILLKPMTYMNLSGSAVKKALQAYGGDIADCMVCFDDLHLPVGALRMRPSGSAAGHNGLQNIIDTFGTQDIPRLRIGIGDDFPRGMQAQYVLSRFNREERELLEPALDRAIDGLMIYLRSGINEAMSTLNRTT